MNKIKFFTLDGYCWVEVESILYLQAEAKKVKLFLKENLVILLDMNLRDCFELLPTRTFLYINRAIVINLHHVFRLKNVKGQRGEVIIMGKITLEVSRRKKEELISAMGNLVKKSSPQ